MLLTASICTFCKPKKALSLRLISVRPTASKTVAISAVDKDDHKEGRPVPQRVAASTLAAGLVLLTVGCSPAEAATKAELYDRGVERCTMEQLKKGADTRASFSDFAGEPELEVNIEGCDYSGKDLSKDVLSGVRARGANFANAQFGPQSSRADFRGADMRGANFRSTNLYQALFNGADLRGANFEGALASGAKFGFDSVTKQWTNLEGANFEDTLFSTSDIVSICQNPTMLEDDRALLGCRD